MHTLPQPKGSSRFLFVSTILLFLFLCCTVSQAQTGITWTTQTTPGTNSWYSVAYGNGLFVAVAYSGVGNRVMTSPDGVIWTSGASAADNNWGSVTYGNGLFVAVAYSGTGNRVMTSPDGIAWTIRTSPADNEWNSITYGNNLFVAVSSTGTGNRVMTSIDGVTWSIITSAADNSWMSVTYGNGLFVAVAYSGVGNRVMTSADGVAWTARASAADNSWRSVTYGSGLFVAVSASGTGNRVMTSPDGIVWTSRTSAADNAWNSVTYGNGLFVAVALSGTGNRVMTSPDGITWTIRTSAANNSWNCVTFANGIFVSVAGGGTYRVMTSGTFTTLPVGLLSFSGKNNINTHELIWQTASENNNHHFDVESSSTGITFEKIGTVVGAGSSSTIKSYQFIDVNPNFGINHYRLKQTDVDGGFKYSKIITIKKIAGNSVSIYPNPASNILNLQTISKYIGSAAQVISIEGKLLKTIYIIKNVEPINIKDLPANTYLLKLNDGTTYKFIKE